MLGPLYPKEKHMWYLLNRMQGGPELVWMFRREKSLSLARSRTLDRPARSGLYTTCVVMAQI